MSINTPSYFTDSTTDNINLPNFSKYIYNLNATIKMVGQQSDTQNANMMFEDSDKFTPRLINPEVKESNLFFTPYIKLTKFDLQKSNADRYKEKTKLTTKDYIKFFSNKNLIFNFIAYKKAQFENENKDDTANFGELIDYDDELIGGRKLPMPSTEFFETGIPANNEDEYILTMGNPNIGDEGEPPTRPETPEGRREFYENYQKNLLITQIIKYSPGYTEEELKQDDLPALKDQLRQILMEDIFINKRKLLKKYKKTDLEQLDLKNLENVIKNYNFEENKDLLSGKNINDLDELTLGELNNVIEKEKLLQRALKNDNITNHNTKADLEAMEVIDLEGLIKGTLIDYYAVMLEAGHHDLDELRGNTSLKEVENYIETEQVMTDIINNKYEMIAKYSEATLREMGNNNVKVLKNEVQKEDLLDSIQKNNPELIEKYGMDELNLVSFKDLQHLEKKEEILEDNLNFIKRLFFSKGDTVYLKGKPYTVQKSTLGDIGKINNDNDTIDVTYTIYIIEGKKIPFLKKQKFNCAVRSDELDEDVQKIFSTISNTVRGKGRPKLTPELAPDLQGRQLDQLRPIGRRSKHKSRDSRESRKEERTIKDYIGIYIRDYQRKNGYPDTRYPPLRAMMIDSENKFPEKLGRNMGEILDYLSSRYSYSHNDNDKNILKNIIKDYHRTYNLHAEANKGITNKYKRERDEDIRQRIGNTILKNIIRHVGGSSKRKLRKSKNPRKPKKPRKTKKIKKSRKQRKKKMNTRKKAKKHRRTRKH